MRKPKTANTDAHPGGTTPRRAGKSVLKRGKKKENSVRCGALRAVRCTARAGAERYDRARHLPHLIRALPGEAEGEDPATLAAIVTRLAQVLTIERRRARSGHRSYDLNRHIALIQALAAERRHLRDG